MAGPLLRDRFAGGDDDRGQAEGFSGSRTAAEPIGISCRLCPRPACDQRAFPPADRAIAIDPDMRDVVPYRVL